MNVLNIADEWEAFWQCSGSGYLGMYKEARKC